MNWKVVLRSVLMEYGALCVMICGELKRLVWPVGSWDSLQMVLYLEPKLYMVKVQGPSSWTMLYATAKSCDYWTVLLMLLLLMTVHTFKTLE